MLNHCAPYGNLYGKYNKIHAETRFYSEGSLSAISGLQKYEKNQIPSKVELTKPTKVPDSVYCPLVD